MGTRRKRHCKTPQLLSLGGSSRVFTAGAALTQEGGGVLLTFGLEQRLSWVDNLTLTLPPPAIVPGSTPDFPSASSRKPRKTVWPSILATLRGEDAGSGFGFSLDSPSAELALGARNGPSSSITLSAFLRETDLGEGLTIDEGSVGELPVLLFEDGSARTKGVRLSYDSGVRASSLFWHPAR